MNKHSASPRSNRGRLAERRDQLLQRAARAIEFIRPLLFALRVFLVGWIVLGVISSIVLTITIWNQLAPRDRDDIVLTITAGVLLLIPSVVLGLAWLALTGVSELPNKLRSLPEAALRHRDTLQEIGRETRGRNGLLRNAGRTLKLLYRSREDLLVYMPVLELLNPLVLTGTALAIPLIILEVLFAAAALLG